MSESMVIQSHKGPYSVVFDDNLLSNPARLLEGEPHFLIDSNVARLYARQLHFVLVRPNTIVLKAVEENKSIENIIPVMEMLVRNKVKRDHTLVAIGGGIVQDITCFIASTLMRGVAWRFVPTTLLAQADSCIGSKSSINLGDTKNILGTFNPPQVTFIDSGFLESLEKRDINSGIGEILKVHAINGAASFDRLTSEFNELFSNRTVLLRYIRQALLIKQPYIEQDEFDRGVRNIFNYGHSFGHAIESATNYQVPHGIGVTLGMDMANFIAVKRELLPKEHYHRMHPILRKNYAQFAATEVPIEGLLAALMKDKKNTTANLRLIFPVGERAEVKRIDVVPDESFRAQCAEFLAQKSR